MNDFQINSIRDLKRDGKSFYWASFFLPRKYKLKAGKLYSICRFFDDVADNDSEDKSIFLIKSVEEIKNDKKNIINIFLNQNNINLLIFEDLIHGLINDQKIVKIKNKNELITYCYKVAGTVGLMMSKIIGVENNKANSCAIDLGIAMQLTNIARDVYEDAHMHRIYLPADWIPGITLPILRSQNTAEPEQEEIISNAIHKIIDLSEKFYLNGFSGLNYIPYRTRLGIFIAANIYRGISIKIKKYEKQYLRKRIYLNSFEKFLITIRSIFKFMFISFINYKYKEIRQPLQNENL